MQGADLEPNLNTVPASRLTIAKSDRTRLVLCSQVLEHVWHFANFFDFLELFRANQTVFGMAARAAHRPHASPDFYCAGVTSKMIAKNSQVRGFRIVDHGQLGSERLYCAALVEDCW